MLSDPKHQDRLYRLAHRIRLAEQITPALMADVVADVCTRLPLLQRTASAARLDKLIETGAWSDATLALIDLELPAWKLRRLVHEDGEWFCSLSRELNLPITLDDTADARHETLPLAMLNAFVEACCRTRAVREINSPQAPQAPPTLGHAVCCDNFA